MINFIRKLKLLFTYGPELNIFLKRLREEELAKERERTKNFLRLCEKHQQADRGWHYSEKNCDYCKLLAERDQILDLLEEERK